MKKAEKGQNNYAAAPATTIEMSAKGVKQAKKVFKEKHLPDIISGLSLLLSLFVLVQSMYRQNNDSCKVLLDGSFIGNSVAEYLSVTEGRSTKGALEIEYPLIISNLSDHSVIIVNYQCTRSNCYQEYAYSSTLSDTQTGQTQTCPFVIDAGSAASLKLAVNVEFGGYTARKLDLESSLHPQMKLGEFISYLENNNISFPEYKITFYTARGNSFEYSLRLTSDVF